MNVTSCVCMRWKESEEMSPAQRPKNERNQYCPEIEEPDQKPGVEGSKRREKANL